MSELQSATRDISKKSSSLSASQSAAQQGMARARNTKLEESPPKKALPHAPAVASKRLSGPPLPPPLPQSNMKYSKYERMKKCGVPPGAIAAKMLADGMSKNDITQVLGVSAQLGQPSSQTGPSRTKRLHWNPLRRTSNLENTIWSGADDADIAKRRCKSWKKCSRRVQAKLPLQRRPRRQRSL